MSLEIEPAPNPWTGAVHHESVLPEEVAAARIRREAARRAQKEATRVRRLVVGIWLVALTLGALVAFALAHT